VKAQSAVTEVRPLLAVAHIIALLGAFDFNDWTRFRKSRNTLIGTNDKVLIEVAMLTEKPFSLGFVGQPSARRN
jgi:hypothetical protein